MKKNYWLFVLAGTALVFGLSACRGGGGQSSDSSQSYVGSDSSGNSSEEGVTASVNTGFEDEKALYVFEAGNGAEISLNTDKEKVFTGERSLKISVSSFATAEFKFSECIEEKVITDYEFLSFWLYSDFDGTLAIANDAQAGTYIDDDIEQGKWTKIVLRKDTSVYDVIQYNLSFNSFLLNAMGKDYGNVVEYDIFIDDVRLYKEGLAGECTLEFDDGKGGIADGMPVGLAGTEYVLPKVRVYSPEGYALHGVDAELEKQVFAPDGGRVEIIDGKISVDRIGRYVYDCFYVRDGIENRLTSEFEIVFADFDTPRMGVGKAGEEYVLPELGVYRFGSEEALDNVKTAVSVKSPKGNAVSDELRFTPAETGRYIVEYTVFHTVNGVENSAVVTRPFWVTGVNGLAANFSFGEENMFSTKGTTMIAVSSGERFKTGKDESADSLKLTASGNRAVNLLFTENFPYGSMEGKNYLFMWIYNGSEMTLTAELTNCAKSCLLSPKAWNAAIFYAEDFFDGFDGAELLVYDGEKQAALNCDLYIDDIRVIADGDAEEVLFAKNVTTEDYDPSDGSGRRFAANYEYELELSLFSVKGELLSGKAIVESVKDKRNRKTTVRDGKFFTPTVVGRYTITLVYEKDGIISSVEKVIEVSEQMLLSPDETFMLRPAEQGKEYRFDSLPELWNYGVIEEKILPEISVYNLAGKEISLNGNSFIPTETGKYTVFFLARDTKIASSNALLEVTLTVYPAGKYGVIADFEDGNSKVLEATTYYYGEVSDFSLTDARVHGGTKSALFRNMSPDTREMTFGIATDNLAGDISRTKYFSFWIYIEDETGDNDYRVVKRGYANWIHERDKSFVPGSLNVTVKANRWVEIRVDRADYEKVLGGTIFAGQTISLGGSMWTAENNAYITGFNVVDNQQPLDKSLKVYIDDITVGY